MAYKTYEVRIYANGDKRWYLDGKLHCEDGPAIVYAKGHKEYRMNGKLHREDGPAIESATGIKEWYLDGINMTEQEFNLKTKSCSGKIVVVIDGKEYRLTEI